jgi:hypothetical protein
MASLDTDGHSVTYYSDQTGSPDLRLIHYNDVYHVEYAPLWSSLPHCLKWTYTNTFYLGLALQNLLAEYLDSNHS